uniref:Endonuclease/exonuclease/phosphatase domain-containing protein n=1 Tax=Loa loa TaxID=7209 RepID=A0A1I7VGI5_LOALO
MVKKSIASKLENPPTDHSDHASHYTTSNKFSHAPILQTDLVEKKKNRFYTNLCRFIQKVPSYDKVIIFGDLNARVEKNFEAWKSVLGKHGIGNCNDNERFLLEFCAKQQLTITNVIFQQGTV